MSLKEFKEWMESNGTPNAVIKDTIFLIATFKDQKAKKGVVVEAPETELLPE